MSERAKQIIGITALAAIVALAAYIIFKDRDKLAAAANIGSVDLGLIVAGCFAFIATQGYILRAACRPFGVMLSHRESFGLIVVTFFINYCIPFLGFGVRGAYLAKQHGMRLIDFGTTLVAILTIELGIYAAAGLIGLGLLWHGGLSPDPVLALIFLGFVTLALVAGAFPLWLVPRKPAFMAKVVAQLESAQSLLRRPGVTVPIVVWTVIELAGFTLAFWAAFRAMGAAVPVAGAAVAAAVSDFSFLIRLTPAAAGSFEAAVYYAGLGFGVSLSQAIAIALLVRLGLILVFLPTGPVFFWTLLKRSGVL